MNDVYIVSETAEVTEGEEGRSSGRWLRIEERPFWG